MSQKFMIIGFRARQGFTTNLMHVLQYLDRAEKSGYTPVIHWQGGTCAAPDDHYNGIDSPNIWDYFFEPINEHSIKTLGVSKKDMNRVKDLRKKRPDLKIVHNYMHDYYPAPSWSMYLYPPNVCLCNPSDEFRQFAHGIIQKYVKVRKIVTDKADNFYNENLTGKHILGIHLRGVKELEEHQGIDYYKRYLKYTEKYIGQHPDCHIFLATDSHRHLVDMEKEFGDRLICQKDIVRSKNNYPVQYGCREKRKRFYGGAKTAEEVLTEIILLSRSDFMLRGFSNVPCVASFLSPTMPMHFVCEYAEKARKDFEQRGEEIK